MQTVQIDISTPNHPNTFALIDAGDERLLTGVKKWSAKAVGDKVYAYGKCGGKRVAMHRSIMGVTNRYVHVDHINGNPADNRRENLRLCTRSQNMQNRAVHRDMKSGFKGVYKQSHYEGWQARIQANGKSKQIGTFSSPEAAARAYDAAALKAHGEFAKTNAMMGLL